MKFSKRKVKSQNQVEGEKVRQEATSEAQFASALASLVSLLDVNSERGKSLEDTVSTWCGWQLDLLVSRYGHVFETRLPWWSYLRNPIWTFIFSIQRWRLLRKTVTSSVAELEKLDYLLGRAEFMFPISPAARHTMRKKIACGAISRWTALSLVISCGCKMTKDGEISPRPVGKLGLVVGLVITFVMTVAFFVLAIALGSEFKKPCVQQCVVIGATQMMVLTASLGAMSLSLSWGRQRKARLLSWITAASRT